MVADPAVVRPAEVEAVEVVVSEVAAEVGDIQAADPHPVGVEVVEVVGAVAEAAAEPSMMWNT